MASHSANASQGEPLVLERTATTACAYAPKTVTPGPLIERSARSTTQRHLNNNQKIHCYPIAG